MDILKVIHDFIEFVWDYDSEEESVDDYADRLISVIFKGMAREADESDKRD